MIRTIFVVFAMVTRELAKLVPELRKNLIP